MRWLKKCFLLLFAFVLLTCFVNAWNNAEIDGLVSSFTHSSLKSCTSNNTFHQVMYLWSQGHELVDTLSVTDPNYTSYVWQIRSKGSNKEKYTYYSVYNAIPNAISVPALKFYSEGKPHNVGTVVVMGTKDWAKITSNIPSTYKRSEVAAQVVYHVYRIWYKRASWPQKMTYTYHNAAWDLVQNSNYTYGVVWNPSPEADDECLNIHIWFCWDWILDNWSRSYSEDVSAPGILNGWEECDDGANNGTSSSNCTSNCKIKPDVASCGSANWKEYESKPTSNLCWEWTASTVTEWTTKYTWTCTKWKVVESCEAKRLQPTCWEANGWTYESKPTTKLCWDWSTASTVKEEDWQYKWSCKRSWLEVSCSANKKEPDVASCWSANWGEYESKPTSNLCWDWSTASTVTEWTTKYTWTCTKWNDEKSCEAKRLQPLCWEANGWTYESKPTTKLCGDWSTSSTVIVKDKKYEWTCKRSWLEVSCDANRAQPSCWEANGWTYESKPTTKLCGDWSTASTVTEKDGQYKWSCKRSWLEVSCSADKKEPDKASCWSANWKEYESKPTTNLCWDWTASAVTEWTTKYTWTCTKWSDVKSCEAKRLQPSCWEANGWTYESKPTTKLCGDWSTASKVKEENGKYKWSCKRSWLEKQCSATKEKEPVVQIDGKEVMWDSTTFKIWEKIWFKVAFSNPTNSVVTDVVIKDLFPIQLDYDGKAKVEGVWNVNIWTYLSWTDWLVVEFSWFSMQPKQSWYLYITWIVNSISDNGINWVCSYKKDWTTDNSLCKEARFEFKKDLKISKSASSKEVSVWSVVDYTITIQNNGWEYSWLKIIDTLSWWLSYINNSPASVIKWNAEIKDQRVSWNQLIVDLGVWDFWISDIIELKYSVKVDELRDTYGNLVCVHDGWWQLINCGNEKIKKETAVLSIDKKIGKTDDFNGTWLKQQIFEGSSGAYFKIDVENTKGAVNEFVIHDKINYNQFSFDLKDWDSLNYRINKKWNDTYTFDYSWEIVNWELVITGVLTEWAFLAWDVYSVIIPATLLSEEWTNEACLSNWQCSNASFGSVPTPRYCWDWIQNWIEYCDLWENWWIINSAGKLFSNENIFDSKYANWSCTKDCTLKNESVIPKCFNVQNGSISIMSWEFLPFYWNIEWMLGTHTSDERKAYLKDNFFSNWEQCNVDNVYKIDLSSLLCDFYVYWPSVGWEKNIVYTLQDIPCVWINWWWNESGYYKLMQSYISQNWSWWFAGSVWTNWPRWEDMKNVFETLDNGRDYGYPTLFPFASKLIIENFWAPKSSVLWTSRTVSSNWNGSPLKYFWEYKVSLDRIKYRYCGYVMGDEWVEYKMMDKEFNERVCEVDFSVTDHYLVQKSPYGFIDETTKTNLKSYRLKNGYPLFEFEAWDQKVSNYQMLSSVSGNFDTFISKYSIAAKGEWQLRQVPWKSIFITDLDAGQKFNLSDRVFSNVLNSGKPFTLIASKWADIVIKGNVVQNMMIITQWKIIFDAEGSCNAKREGTTKYSKAWQVVQWIFYAWSWFDSDNDILNNDFNHEEWCNYWNLHIKWVVLWKLKDVKNKRRSELYTWFNPHDEKRDIVLNWASVMIEFNSNLLTSDIPWVSEFNKLLTTQRE